MEKADIFGDLKLTEFEHFFSNDDSCLKWISEKKWENGFVCKKCGNTNYCTGSTPHSRRCTRCKSTESATAHTLFHRCRLPLPDAFLLAYQICNNPNYSSRKLSQQTEIRSMTCWSLKTKLLNCLKKGGCDSVFGIQSEKIIDIQKREL